MALKIFFRGLKTGFTQFGESINKTINAVLLTIAYLLGVGMAAIIAKIKQKNLLHLKHEKKDSYYRGLMLTAKAKKEYYRQF